MFKRLIIIFVVQEWLYETSVFFNSVSFISNNCTG